MMTTRLEIKSSDDFWAILFPECFYLCRNQFESCEDTSRPFEPKDTLKQYWRNIRTGDVLVVSNTKLEIITPAPVQFTLVYPTIRFNIDDWRAPDNTIELTAALFETLPDNTYYYQTAETPRDGYTTKWFNISNGSMITRLPNNKIIYSRVAEPGFTTVLPRLFNKFSIWQ